MVASTKVCTLVNFGTKVFGTHEALLPSRSDKSEQEKVQDCSYNFRANCLTLNFGVYGFQYSRMLNKKKADLILHVENLFSHPQFIKRRQTLLYASVGNNFTIKFSSFTKKLF